MNETVIILQMYCTKLLVDSWTCTTRTLPSFSCLRVQCGGLRLDWTLSPASFKIVFEMKLHKFVVNSNDSSVVCIIGVTAGLIVALREIIPPAFAGLALVYSSQLTGILQNVVRFASETESRFTSVQRIQTYLQVKFPFIKVKLIFSSFDYLHLFF